MFYFSTFTTSLILKRNKIGDKWSPWWTLEVTLTLFNLKFLYLIIWILLVKNYWVYDNIGFRIPIVSSFCKNKLRFILLNAFSKSVNTMSNWEFDSKEFKNCKIGYSWSSATKSMLLINQDIFKYWCNFSWHFENILAIKGIFNIVLQLSIRSRSPFLKNKVI